jgi:hypothetical protein
MTVIKAKALRNRSEVKEEEKQEVDTTTKEEVEEATPTNEFKLPDNAGKLNDLVAIVTKHPGPIFVRIGTKEFQLDEIGLHKIRDLLG